MKHPHLLVALLLLTAKPFYAAPGDLDTTFGTGGRVVTDIRSYSDGARTVAVQSDGKVVVAGEAGSFNGNDDFAMVRYNVDGTLDSSFGTGGKVTTNIGIGDDSCNSIVLQSDGKIVLAGDAEISGNLDFALVRYNVNGTLDSTFGTNGKVTTSIGSSYDICQCVVMQSDGKFVLGGYSNNGSNYDFALVRYNTNGALDGSFGTGGKITTAIGNSDDMAYSAAVQSDGKIVLAGRSSDFAVVRYTSNGVLDSSFGTGGKVITPFGSGGAVGRSVALQTDGKILLGGYGGAGSSNDFALVRYNMDGTLDSSFGTGGKVTTDFNANGQDYCYSLALRSNGKIVLAGYTTSNSSDFAMACYASNGVLDTSIGTGGKVTTNFPGSFYNGTDRASHVALQSDGKIVLVGSTSETGSGNFAVVRYTVEGPNIATVSTQGVTSITPNNATLNGTVNPNGLTTTAQFEYGLSIDYGSTASVTLSPNNGPSAQNVSELISGLASNTTYHYRLFASNADGEVATTDNTFTTSGPPAVSLAATTGITATGATLSGVVNPNGLATTAQFEYGLTTGYGSTASVTLYPNNGTSAQNVEATLSGLAPGTTYLYRLTATNSGGDSSTTGGSFNTPSPPVLSLPGSPLLVEATSASGAVAHFTVTANDVQDGVLTPTVSATSGSTFPMGDTTVNASVTDSSSLTTTGSFIPNSEVGGT